MLVCKPAPEKLLILYVEMMIMLLYINHLEDTTAALI